MATFSAVNTALSPPENARTGDEQTPTTPKPTTNFAEEQQHETTNEESMPNTPTRNSFGGVTGQRPLPEEPATPAQAIPNESQESRKRDGTYREATSEQPNDSQDVEMGEGDDDIGEDDASDNDSVTSESQRPSKKKKGQRFFCTDFPPCQLSFTRSEHLARHIRYDELSAPHLVVILTVMQKAYRRTALPVPLFSPFLETR